MIHLQLILASVIIPITYVTLVLMEQLLIMILMTMKFVTFKIHVHWILIMTLTQMEYVEMQICAPKILITILMEMVYVEMLIYVLQTQRMMQKDMDKLRLVLYGNYSNLMKKYHKNKAFRAGASGRRRWRRRKTMNSR